MIPRKLQIKNFLSYGDEAQAIDFSHYKLICLSGKNGHGKSALLDAMTWAIWGQARKVSSSSKADEGLLRLGQDSMMVIFDFELNNQTYRIKREFVYRYGKPYTGLEFGILDPMTEGYKPLTAKTIRDTQAQIENNIKLTFDSFINSAFLRQGQSNEFSKKSPKERKEILASILGLTEYEVIRKLALDKIRQCTQEKNTLTTLQTTLETELARLPEIQHEFATTTHQIQELQQEQRRLALEGHTITTVRTQIELRQQQYRAAQLAQEKTAAEYTHTVSILRDHIALWRSIHAHRSQTNTYHLLDAEKQQLSTSINASQQMRHQQLELQQQLLSLQTTLQTIEHTIRQEHEARIHHEEIQKERLQSDLINLTDTKAQLENQIRAAQLQIQQLLHEVAQLATHTTHATAHTQHLNVQEQQFIKRKAYYQKYIAHANWLTTQGREFFHNQQLISEGPHPSCPLCHQIIPIAQRHELTERLRTRQQFIAHQVHRLRTIIALLKEKLFEQHEYLKTLKLQQEQYLKQQTALEELTKQLSAAQASYAQLQTTHQQLVQRYRHAQQQLDVCIKNLEQLKKQMPNIFTHNELYQDLVIQIDAIKLKIQQSIYDHNAYQHAQQRMTVLDRELTLAKDIVKNSALQDKRKEDILALIKQLRQIKAEHTALQVVTAQYHTIDAQIQELAVREQQYVIHHAQCTDKQALMLQHKGRLETKLQILDDQQKQYATNNALLKSCNESALDYEQIAQATGKDGIQALLIEDAIPEIEQEANSLLARLTNNQAQLSIESLRDLKKGGTKETLDIKISDSAGIRAYELFSGGEAFRIDFALRIAISKLLARRAGTALQTLIIDEGFGSQDDEGLSHIMDVMYTIQDDFQKIIIVSHLPTMKNQFPVHFWVEKRPSGSRVTVIEQD